MTRQNQLVARTFFGLEDVLAKEIQGLGGRNIQILRRAVSFEGDTACMYKANLWLRTAISVLKYTDSFKARDEDALYKGIKKINWPAFFDVNKTMAIHAVVVSPYFKHSKYPALKAKDAIVDLFREKTGKRPTVDTKSPDFVINIHIADDMVTVSMDSSGIPLFKRGYRKFGEKAPLNEALAAGLVLLSDWDRQSLLIDMMCGSGTILIEAAMIAANIPPGLVRKDFAFQHWKDYDRRLWDDIVEQAKNNTSKEPPKIIGNDRSSRAIQSARQNINNAGLNKLISLQHGRFEDLKTPPAKGWIITNPPYGQRLQPNETEALYQSLGTTLKHTFPGFKAWILSANPEALKNIGLKHSANIKLFNGQLECSYRKYELFEGKRKKWKEEDKHGERSA